MSTSLIIFEVKVSVLLVPLCRWRERGSIKNVMVDFFASMVGILSMTGDGLSIFWGVYLLLCPNLSHKNVLGGQVTFKTTSIVVCEHLVLLLNYIWYTYLLIIFLSQLPVFCYIEGLPNSYYDFIDQMRKEVSYCFLKCRSSITKKHQHSFSRPTKCSMYILLLVRSQSSAILFSGLKKRTDSSFWANQNFPK